jgi:hypothetical protein
MVHDSMKNTKWLMLVGTTTLFLLSGALPGLTQAPTGQVPAGLSPAALEVVKLAEAGTSEDVILAYIQNSSSPFSLSADQILYLKDIGLSSEATSAMLNRDNALRSVPPPAAPTVAPPVAAPAPASATAPPPSNAAAPTYVGSPPPDVTYFYNDLSPYGTWVALPDYGWCWQPTVVVINRGWRPYCDGGYWAYTDFGWCWASTYSWGWAPFHYGRWFLHPRCGWVWTPDRVWGPAWVTWRVAGSQCGWAPLPPHSAFDVHVGWTFNGVHVGVGFDFGLHADHFTFVAAKDFDRRDFEHCRLPPAEVTRVYNKTTIVNNYVVNNNVIVNRGLKVEQVNAATHSQVRKMTIRDLPAGSPASARFQGSDKTSLMVYRPQFKAPARSANMVAQKLDERHPAIQHAELGTLKAGRPSTAGRPAYTAPKPFVTSPTPTSSGSARRSVDESKPATHSMPGYGPGAPTPSYSRRAAGPTQPIEAGPASQGYSSHIYYPKTYHQTADIRSLPPLYPREQSEPSRSDKGSGSHSKEK